MELKPPSVGVSKWVDSGSGLGFWIILNYLHMIADPTYLTAKREGAVGVAEEVEVGVAKEVGVVKVQVTPGTLHIPLEDKT